MCLTLVAEGWDRMTTASRRKGKGLRSLIILIMWEIWKKINLGILQNKVVPPLILIGRIREPEPRGRGSCEAR